MRLMIPLIAAMTLAAGAASADQTSSAMSKSSPGLGAPAKLELSTMPILGQDVMARRVLADQAVKLINSGDCVGARRMVARRGDGEMLLRVDQVCAAPVAASAARPD